MKKKNLLRILIISSLFSQMSFAQEENQLTDGPQTLDGNLETEPSAPKTEIIKKDNAENLGVDLENKKNPNGEVLSEEDLLKPKAKKETSNKVESKKINESEIYIQEADKYKITDKFKSLKLNDVIEQGLRKNYDQNLRDQKQNLSDLTFEGLSRSFWYPNIKLTLSTGDQLISLLRKSSRAQTANNSITPSGYLGLSFDDYTVFNWGKDYALFLNKKQSYEREKTANLELKRELRLSLISDFFDLAAYKTFEKIYQDQLRHASFVYRLNKEKITVGKTSQQDYYQSRSEYLRAQNEYHQAKMNADVADENLSFKIADDVGTKYILIEQLDYKRIKISLEDAINLANAQNPTLLSNKTTLINAERSYDVAQKENLPLPKFSVNLGAYNKTFGPRTNKTIYETQNGNGNVELVASVNATWDLVGEDGFLNSNKLAKSRINRELANYELGKNKHFIESNVRETYKNILSYQNQMLILEARLPAVQKTFDTVLENYLNNKARYNDFHIALNELTETKLKLEETKLYHLKEKLNLAKAIGAEDFPGENFEHLAIKVKGK